MIIESKDGNTDPLTMCLMTICQTTIEQAENDTTFSPSLYHSALTVRGSIVLTAARRAILSQMFSILV